MPLVDSQLAHDTLRAEHQALQRRFEEQSLELSRIRDLLDMAPDALLVVESDGRIAFVSARAERLFGYQRAELIGQHLEMLIPGRFRRDHADYVAKFIAKSEARPMGSGLELFGRRKDGTEVPIEVSLSPLRTKRGITVSAAIRDISERKRAEASEKLAAERLASTVEKAREAADAANRAKSEFLSSMSHELRTPLNAILGFAQLLRRDKKDPLSDRNRERVAQILKGGAHLLRLIDDILDLSRIEAGRVSMCLEAVSVLEVVEELRKTLEPMATPRAICLELEAVNVPAVVAVDRLRFAQILMNFGSNAIKYNRPAGKVTFSASTPKPGHVRVSVRDNGVGIPADKQDELFRPFARAGQETGAIEGTGLGLVISRRLAQSMSGDVGFRSVRGEGSEFWVDVPVVEGLALPERSRE